MKIKSLNRISCMILCLILTLICILQVGITSFAATTSNTLLNTYGQYFGHVGTCINSNQLKNASTLNQVKSQYNSITLENEMKPDALLGRNATLLTVAQAKALGYYIPSGYTETTVPKINFSTVDSVLKICSDNGIKVRAHTLVWHSQTPSWFFKSGYTSNNGYVSTSVMNARMELYIKTIMNHVYSGSYGKCVYAWDVVNEYFHATDSGWEAVYGKCGTTPGFVKSAFQYAHDCLDYYGLTNSVSLFYNDYNTYMEVNDVISMIKYINKDTKLCNGIGMQSHLSTTYPSVDYYTSAMQSFVNAGLEVQVTELDVKNTSDSAQAAYLYNLMTNILKIKKNGGKITGITFWGLSDDVSWISGGKALLFSNLTTPKQSYYQVLKAYTDLGLSGSSSSSGTSASSSSASSSSSSSSASSSALSDGWYYIKNTNSQKYLQVTNNAGGNGVNVEIGTGSGVKGQKWYLTNNGNGYFTLKNGQGYMLDVAYGKDADGTNIQTYSANNEDAQLFSVVKTSTSGVYGICTKVSSGKKALDVYNFGTSDGSNVCEWTYYQNSCQLWAFESCSN